MIIKCVCRSMYSGALRSALMSNAFRCIKTKQKKKPKSNLLYKVQFRLPLPEAVGFEPTVP